MISRASAGSEEKSTGVSYGVAARVTHPRTMQTSRSPSSITVLVLVFFLASLAGCAKAAPASEAAPSAPAVAAAGETGASPLAAADRSLIVTMDVAITVDHVDEATARIRSAVEQAGGFVADSRTSGIEEQTAHLELRVPADKARNIKGSLAELGTVTSASEKVEDVTEQRADIEARLHTARVQEKRLLEIMSGRASSIHELVEAEKELARVRENIERLEAQERVMKSKIQLATVRVTLSTRTAPAWQTPGPSIARAGRAGVQAAAAVAVFAGMAAAAVGPTLLPILFVVGAIVMVVRRRRAAAAVIG